MSSSTKNEMEKSYQNNFNLLSSDLRAIIDSIMQVRELSSTIGGVERLQIIKSIKESF